jgi:hypothetical protein
MAFVLADRVRDTTTTTGTGTVTLSGTAPTGYQTFGDGIGNGNNTYYTINADSQWEVGIGTYTASGTTLARNTVLASSNGGALVDFAIGTKDVYCDYPAEKAVTDVYGTALAATTAANIGGGAAGSIPYQTAANTTSLLAAGTGVLIGGATPSYTMSPSLTQVTVAADPTTNLQVATKQYVDTQTSAGIHYHEPVRVESPINLNATYNNGTAGVGATLTNAGTQAALVVDGVTLIVADRVLIYQQTNPVQNGIYVVTSVGSGSTNWVLTRSSDADTYVNASPDGLSEGSTVFVQQGTTGAGTTYTCNTTGTIVFGTTAITFVEISSAQIYSAGTGLTLTGTTFSLTSPVATTLGGTGLTSFTSGGAVYATSSSTLTTGTLPATAGGTGQSSYTTGDLVYATSATTLGVIADVATGNALISGGAGGDPSYGKIGLTTHITGTLAVGNGGTGATSLTGYLVGNGTSAFTATATIPTSALSGTISLTTQVSGTLGAGNGGTGISSYTVGDILYASGTTALSSLADVATGNALISGGVSNAPLWGKIGLTTHVSGTLPVSNGGSGATTLTGYLKGNGTSAFTASATIPGGDITGAALTEFDDTNVTMTLGGSPSTALLAATSMTLGWTGQLAVSRGGTGNSTLTSNYLLKGNGVSPVAASIIFDNGTNVGMGTALPASRLQIAEANRADSTNIANVGIYTTTTQSTGVGGTLALGGLFNGSDLAPFGSIRGGKQNSTSGNYDGYLAFQTIANGGVLTEKMRIDSAGNTSIGTTSALLAATGRGNLTINGSTDAILTFGIAGAYSGYLYSGPTKVELDVQGSRSIEFNTNGSQRLSINSSGNVTANVDFRAPIFYDSNNTAYFADFAGTTSLNAVSAGTITATNFQATNAFYVNGTSYYLNSTGGGWYSNARIQSEVDMRAPIFYDFNNTAYYVDPASTSNLVGLTVANTITGNAATATNLSTNRTNWSTNGTITAVVGQLAWKNYANNHTIFDASNSTSPGGSAVNNTNAEIAWAGTYPTLMGWNGNNTYGVRVDSARVADSASAVDFNNLTNKTGGTGTYTTSGDFRAPIFYDSNNTGFYGDFQSLSNFNRANFTQQADDASSSIYLGGQSVVTSGSLWINFHTDGDTAYRIGKPAGAWTQPLEIRFYTGQRFRASASYGGFQFINYNTNGVVFDMANGGNFTRSNVDFYAPIMYDNNDSGYYVDPNSTSVIFNLNVTGTGNKYLLIQSTSNNEAMVRYLGATGPGWYVGKRTSTSLVDTASFHFFSESAGATVAGIDVSGNMFASTSFRAPIFYDSNNTGFYVDPASGTVLGGSFTVTGGRPLTYAPGGGDLVIQGDAGGWATGLYFRGSAGTTRGGFGALGGGDGLSYLWAGNAYNNAALYLYASNYAESPGSFRAPIFYDSGNTGYYFDGTGTSRWNTSNQDGFHTFNNYGLGIVGLYASTRYQLVWALGDAYKGNADGTSLSGAYGLWFSYPSAGGPAANLSTHGLMLIQNGSFMASLDPSMRAIYDMRSPIFYDLDNTAFFLDPNSTSVLSTVRAATIQHSSGNRAITLNGATWTEFCDVNGATKLWLGGTGDPNNYYNANIHYFRNTSSSTTMTIDSSGNVVATANVTAYSDARLKKDVETIGDALGLVGKMRGVRYTRIDTEKRNVGVIAQEMLEVIPEVVHQGTGADDTLSVAYGNLVGVLIEAIKELEARVAELEGK